MKPLLFVITMSITITVTAQSPALMIENPEPAASFGLKAIGDTITFNSSAQNEVITDQFESAGVIFSGSNGTSAPVIHDYGSGNIGKVLHSSDWYGELRMDFEDPSNPGSIILISAISFDNPVPSEIDYLVIKIYDLAGSLVHHSSSSSPAHVDIDLGSAIGAYAILDDSAGTAYVVDNIVINGSGVVGIEPTESDIGLTMFPNPSLGTVRLSCQNEIRQIEIFDLTGRIIMSRSVNAKTTVINIDEDGQYLVRCHTDSGVIQKRLVTMR